MADCKDSNINTPIYTEATPPASSKGCLGDSAGGNLGGAGVVLPPDFGSGGTGGVTIVEGGNQIKVDDNSYPGVYSFKVHYNPYTALSISLSLISYVIGVAQGALVLYGKIVDRVELSWTYNKTIILQALTNNAVPGYPNPSLDVGIRDAAYSPTTIQVKTIFTMTSNDGENQSGSGIVASIAVDFGNYIMWGDYSDMVLKPEADITALVAALLTQSKTISNSKSRNVYATGAKNRHFYYLLPSRLGEVTFSYNNFAGGFYRLKLINGILKTTISGGEVESDILITNSEGYVEKYYIYQSSSDDLNDSNTPYIIK